MVTASRDRGRFDPRPRTADVFIDVPHSLDMRDKVGSAGSMRYQAAIFLSMPRCFWIARTSARISSISLVTPFKFP
jgi:hypothetical protein